MTVHETAYKKAIDGDIIKVT